MKPLHIATAAAFIFLVLAVYFYGESESWKSRSSILSSEKATLEAELNLTTEELLDEREASAELEKQLSETEEELGQAYAELEACSSQLNLTQGLYSNCTAENEVLTGFLFQTRDELENLTYELWAFEAAINQSMDWFSLNSNIEILPRDIRSDISDCSNGQINLGCIPYTMEKEHEWRYKKESGDRLISIQEITRKRGGDCEDWALFFKASYNYLKEQNGEKDLLSYEMGYGNFFVLPEWYRKGFDAKTIGTTDLYSYIVCYDSHCAAAFSPIKINNSDDIPLLEGSPVVEPQTGEFLFYIGQGGPRINRPENHSYQNIFIVITDDDIYEFYDDGWRGYRDFYAFAEETEEKIQQVREKISEMCGG